MTSPGIGCCNTIAVPMASEATMSLAKSPRVMPRAVRQMIGMAATTSNTIPIICQGTFNLRR